MNCHALRFGLRTLLGVLTIAAIIAGGVADRAHRRARAISVIHAAGGLTSSENSVQTALDHAERMFIYRNRPPAKVFQPSWSERVFGERQRNVCLTDRELTPEVLGAIATLAEIRSLNLSGTNLNDRDLACLRHLRNLECLDLSACPITDRSTETLAAFGDLTWLELDDTQLSDESTQHLARLKKLEVLRIRGTLVTDRGISELCCLTNLRLLASGGSERHRTHLVTTAAVAEINRRLPNCQTVGSYRTVAQP
jgi:hypothetical protein